MAALHESQGITRSVADSLERCRLEDRSEDRRRVHWVILRGDAEKAATA